jgi:molecular chaperone HtpG
MNTFKFDAEIGRVLHLVINSIYTNKEIFLRELISNASDAINKRSYLALSNPDIGLKEAAKIEVKIQKTENIISIHDNGIGMNKEDLIKNIGTIANSGTFKFIENLQKGGSEGISSENMIGQFGVGFYSAFMIAEKIEVKSRKVGEDKCFLWKSEGREEFTIEEFEDKNFTEGTEIKLFVKESEREEFLDKFRLEHIIKTYANHISFDIFLQGEEGIEATKVNESQPIWVKNPSEITKEEYNQFSKSFSWSPFDPFLTLHNKVEGAQEYINLLFIPNKRPFDMYNPSRKTSIKLYVKRVFITEEGVKILPEYLRFVKGIVDSSDLPLNISRETLQNSSIVAKIGKSITKRIFTELKKKLNENREDYKEFWKEFGNIIKEGLCNPEELKDQILEASIFFSSSKKDYITLDEYLANIKPEQESIYYLTADSIEDGINNASLEAFKKDNIEVLILTDTVDDFWTTVITNYKEKSFKNIATADEITDELLSKSATEQENKEDDEKALEIFKKHLDGLVKDVKVSYKLEESPVMLASETGGMSIRMERHLIEQKQLHSGSKKILEINAKHPIIKEIIAQPEQDAKDTILNLFDLACIASGEVLRSNSEFTKRMFSAIQEKNKK